MTLLDDLTQSVGLELVGGPRASSGLLVGDEWHAGIQLLQQSILIHLPAACDRLAVDTVLRDRHLWHTWSTGLRPAAHLALHSASLCTSNLRVRLLYTTANMESHEKNGSKL